MLHLIYYTWLHVIEICHAIWVCLSVYLIPLLQYHYVLIGYTWLCVSFAWYDMTCAYLVYMR